jgi:hypothetical protein
MVDRTRTEEALDELRSLSLVDSVANRLLGRPPVQIVAAAARAVVEAPEVQWCETHGSVWVNDDDGCEAALAAQVKPWREPCRMVKKFLVPAEEET